MGRTPIIVGNWKLNHTQSQGLALVTELKNQLSSIRDVEVGVAPVSVSLAPVAKRLEESSIRVYGQNCHWEPKGAWTGEVSPPLLADAGCKGVILGHSERRQHFGETDANIANKLRAAIDEGLQAILCVGESDAERDAGQTADRVRSQLSLGLKQARATDLDKLVIAYEPIWAIGTGRTASPAQAQEVHEHIRAHLVSLLGDGAAEVRIQYGGSVKPANAESLLSQPDIDGALVGGASLKAEDFVAIVKAARVANGS